MQCVKLSTEKTKASKKSFICLSSKEAYDNFLEENKQMYYVKLVIVAYTNT
jgi:hypothetical protein